MAKANTITNKAVISMSIVVDQQEKELLDNEVEVDLEEGTSLDASDELEANIDPEFELPDKFKDKSMEDVVKSYMEAEKELGRKNNEVGELRKLTDDILKQQIEPTVTKNQIDLDDLLENPNDVITKAMDDNPRIKALEEQLKQAKVETEREKFETEHPDWQNTLQSTDFQSWIQKSAVRQQMFNSANSNYDYAVADELFNTYSELRGASKEVAETKAATKRKKALRNTSAERGSTGEVTKKVYRRADLIRLKQTDPSRYNEPDFQEELLLAYSEGRVR